MPIGLCLVAVTSKKWRVTFQRDSSFALSPSPLHFETRGGLFFHFGPFLLSLALVSSLVHGPAAIVGVEH